MASSTPIQISETSQNSSSKTGLVTSVGSARSYGTVKQSPNLSFQAPGTPRHCMHHTVEEGDTLQGLALKYNVTIQQIQRMNNLWNTDSLHIRPILKIPVLKSNESSRSGSPINTSIMSGQRRASSEQLPFENGRQKSQTISSFNGHTLEEDEEVRSKNSSRRRYESDSVADGEGVKTIAGILNSADEQLILARQFAEKLAQRCAERAPPEGAYNRTADLKNQLSSSDRRSRSPSPFNSFVDSSQHSKGKRVKQSTEKDTETREKVESQLFEL